MKNDFLQFRISTEDKQKIKDSAKKSGLSLTDFVINMCNDNCNDKGNNECNNKIDDYALNVLVNDLKYKDRKIEQLQAENLELRKNTENPKFNNVNGDNYMSRYYDVLSQNNLFKHELNERISIFDKNYTCDDLGYFLFDIEFIEKFRKEYFREWKNNSGFDALFERLKLVYDKGYTASQETEKDLYGAIRTRSDEYRKIEILDVN